jgi:ankyrin repeat protein
MQAILINSNQSASKDKQAIVKLLLEKGANVSVKANSGKTALAMATESNQTNIVEMLKAAGAKE